jgi:hypothetical protein
MTSRPRPNTTFCSAPASIRSIAKRTFAAYSSDVGRSVISCLTTDPRRDSIAGSCSPRTVCATAGPPGSKGIAATAHSSPASEPTSAEAHSPPFPNEVRTTVPATVRSPAKSTGTARCAVLTAKPLHLR